MPHNARPAIDMAIQRIAEVGQGRSTGIYTAIFVVGVLVPAALSQGFAVLQAMHILALSVKQALLFLLLRLCFEPLAHALIPGNHALVGLGGKAATRESFRKWLASRRITYVPLLDSLSQEAAMLIWTEEKLDGLPHDPSFCFERGDGWVGEGGWRICCSTGSGLQ